MATTLSNRYAFALHSGDIDFDVDTFRIALAASAYVYDKDTGANWSNVSGSELAGVNGYVTNGEIMPGTVSITEDDTNDRSDVTWSVDPSWTASGGSIGPTPGAWLYKDTGVASTSTIIGFIDFVTEQTATDGGTFTITGVTVRLSTV